VIRGREALLMSLQQDLEAQLRESCFREDDHVKQV